MSDSDISVKISADTSGVKSAMEDAKRAAAFVSKDLEVAGNAAKQASVNFVSLAPMRGPALKI